MMQSTASCCPDESGCAYIKQRVQGRRRQPFNLAWIIVLEHQSSAVALFAVVIALLGLALGRIMHFTPDVASPATTQIVK